MVDSSARAPPGSRESAPEQLANDAEDFLSDAEVAELTEPFAVDRHGAFPPVGGQSSRATSAMRRSFAA
jgi:hypothetical protein